MREIVLQNQRIQAVFSPQKGMNLIRFRKGQKEIIDPLTKVLFEERLAGLGSLIGPHFHHRDADEIPEVSDDLFPHISKIRAKGVGEPFSHGIGRYVPWQVEVKDETINAHLSSKDAWKGRTFESLEGFSFEMFLNIRLIENGFCLDYSVEAEKPSIVGLHYYYTLPETGGKIRALVEDRYRDGDVWKPIPAHWFSPTGELSFDASQVADYGFIPQNKGDFFEVFYENTEFCLKISFQTEDPSCQIYRPKDASYVCIEPLSARNPKHPLSKNSRLQVKIEVF